MSTAKDIIKQIGKRGHLYWNTQGGPSHCILYDPDAPEHTIPAEHVAIIDLMPTGERGAAIRWMFGVSPELYQGKRFEDGNAAKAFVEQHYVNRVPGRYRGPVSIYNYGLGPGGAPPEPNLGEAAEGVAKAFIKKAGRIQDRPLKWREYPANLVDRRTFYANNDDGRLAADVIQLEPGNWRFMLKGRTLSVVSGFPTPEAAMKEATKRYRYYQAKPPVGESDISGVKQFIKGRLKVRPPSGEKAKHPHREVSIGDKSLGRVVHYKLPGVPEAPVGWGVMDKPGKSYPTARAAAGHLLRKDAERRQLEGTARDFIMSLPGSQPRKYLIGYTTDKGFRHDLVMARDDDDAHRQFFKQHQHDPPDLRPRDVWKVKDIATYPKMAEPSRYAQRGEAKEFIKNLSVPRPGLQWSRLYAGRWLVFVNGQWPLKCPRIAEVYQKRDGGWEIEYGKNREGHIQVPTLRAAVQRLNQMWQETSLKTVRDLTGIGEAKEFIKKAGLPHLPGLYVRSKFQTWLVNRDGDVLQTWADDNMMDAYRRANRFSLFNPTMIDAARFNVREYVDRTGDLPRGQSIKIHQIGYWGPNGTYFPSQDETLHRFQ